MPFPNTGKTQPRREDLAEDRKITRDLVREAENAAREGALVAERLRIATRQYRERLGIPPEENR